jgi:hypothetical protein
MLLCHVLDHEFLYPFQSCIKADALAIIIFGKREGIMQADEKGKNKYDANF